MRVPVQRSASCAQRAAALAPPEEQQHRNVVAGWLAAAALLIPSPGQAFSLTEDSPDAFFVQVGAGEVEVDQTAFGLTWDLGALVRRTGSERVHGYLEISLGQWSGERDGARVSYTQLGVTPALRYDFKPGARRSWFVEGGVGINEIVPVFRVRSKRFSTEFNFGDHFAIGWRADRGPVSEVSFRFQHFSNASIDSPNPGQNFLQLRLVTAFGR